MTIHDPALFIGVLIGAMIFAGFVIAHSIESQLSKIIGLLEAANDTLASILEEVEK